LPLNYSRIEVFAMQTFTEQYHSPDQRQKEAVVMAMTDYLNNSSAMADLGWAWDRIAVSCIGGSSLEQLQHAAKLCLSRMVKEQAFQEVRRLRAIPEQSTFLVDASGSLFYSYNNGITEGHLTTSFFLPHDITAQIAGVASVQEDVNLLATMAGLTGGWIITGDKITIGQWLRFNELPHPSNEQDTRALLDLLNFATLPEPPRFGNYWQLLDAPEDSPFALTEQVRRTIRQTTRALFGDGVLANQFGEGLISESGSPDGLFQSRSYLVQRLIEHGTDYADAYLNALGWQAYESPEVIAQLVVGAMLLDLDPAIDSISTSFAGFDLYSSHFLRRSPAYLRERLEAHLSGFSNVNTVLAPLLAEIVLAGMAPEYLFADWPTDLLLGTPAWVVATQALHFAEGLAPGVTRQMTYPHVLGLGQSVQSAPQLAAIHSVNAGDPIVTWALMNQIISRNAEGSLDQETVTLAIEEYQRYTQLTLDAAKILSTPAPHRKTLAREALSARVPGIDPQMQFHQSPFPPTALVDLYMERRLSDGLWTHQGSVYEKFPALIDLPDINAVYEDKVSQYHVAMTEALENNMVVALSQLPIEDALLIEHAALAIYRIKKVQTHFINEGRDVREELRPVNGESGRFGFILCAANGLNIRCYELFPLRLECKRNSPLEAHFASLVSAEPIRFNDSGIIANAPVDIAAFLQNNVAEAGRTSDIYVEKMEAFSPRSHEKIPGYPNRYFRSPHKEAIARSIAGKCPHLTVAELQEIGIDRTERESRDATYERFQDIFLNIVIPFKGCVQELSSSDPEKRQGALTGCLMDVAVIAMTIAFLPGSIAASVSKSSHVFTRLLSGSRVVASTVVSLFNPLSGSGQLLKGASKLVWRGGSSVARAARHQLRSITGSSSYDLLKALNHTGEAPRIRMSLDALDHARALFQDDSITSIQQDVARLSEKKIVLPKGVSELELGHLYGNAVKHNALDLQAVQALEKLIGASALDQLLTTYIKSRPVRFSDGRFTTAAQDYSEILGVVSQIETKKVAYLKGYQQGVLKQDLGRAPYTDLMPEALFNPTGFTDHAQRAGAWMLNGSTSSGNDFDNVVGLLREYAGNQKSLVDPSVIKEIHRRLVPDLADSVREAGAPTRYGSSITGFALMEQHLRTLDIAHPHFDKHLLATVVGFQGFGDGNGRTASALFSISQLREGRFQPVPKHVFNLLSGMA
jgi:hypothetical protein